MNIKFIESERGIEVIDSIKRHREQIITQKPIRPEYVRRDRIQYPVDAAILITANSFTLPNTGTINIHDEKSEMMMDVGPDEHISLPNGIYTLGVSKSVKIYIRVRGELEIRSNEFHKHITINGSSNIIIGARSYHTEPTETITTTSKPRDLMRAISCFGSALKTTKPERSYPTLRGHPPIIELGNRLDIPPNIKHPEEDIYIEIPSSLEYLYVITPLAYYLGAEVVPGSKPQIVTENGYSFNLDEFNDYEETVEHVLNHIFVLDYIVRTEGNSPGPVYEREKLEPKLEFEISTIYDAPLVERIETYLEVPFSIVKPYYPNQSPKTIIRANEENIKFLPFIAKRLLAIRVARSEAENIFECQGSMDRSFNLEKEIKDPTIQQN